MKKMINCKCPFCTTKLDIDNEFYYCGGCHARLDQRTYGLAAQLATTVIQLTELCSDMLDKDSDRLNKAFDKGV